METAAQPRWSVRWKLLFFVPITVALALISASQRTSDLHRQIALNAIANTFGMVSLISQAVFWIVVRKWTRIGIAMLIFASAVFGFGLHALLRLR